MASIQEIDALLPQTQCGECSYPGCLPYAQALAQGSAAINQCPPGGVALVKALGQLLAIDSSPYEQEAAQRTRPPSIALIREAECIGCTKCIQACPVDAILGSAKGMHTIISHECTGCGLCVAPCPVDCIDMLPQEQNSYDRQVARTRFYAKQTRQIRDLQEQQQSYREKCRLAPQSSEKIQDIQAKKNYIQQALARVQAKKNHE